MLFAPEVCEATSKPNIASSYNSAKGDIDTILAPFRPRPPKRASDLQNQRKRQKTAAHVQPKRRWLWGWSVGPVIHRDILRGFELRTIINIDVTAELDLDI
ncbi:hypothetical protein RRG08_010047 [Elysia crispata]|uniref:Uncharacterized protein n=1 Tax=Elysia crispata TaxID=231223 RepID=A0AAE1EC25_9GAST|nr:hypothetical protein RRG08_010047 [Elysia crispata]